MVTELRQDGNILLVDVRPEHPQGGVGEGQEATPRLRMARNLCPSEAPTLAGTVALDGEEASVLEIDLSQVADGDLDLVLDVAGLQASVFVRKRDGVLSPLTDRNRDGYYVLPSGIEGDDLVYEGVLVPDCASGGQP